MITLFDLSSLDNSLKTGSLRFTCFLAEHETYGYEWVIARILELRPDLWTFLVPTGDCKKRKFSLVE